MQRIFPAIASTDWLSRTAALGCFKPPGRWRSVIATVSWMMRDSSSRTKPRDQHLAQIVHRRLLVLHGFGRNDAIAPTSPSATSRSILRRLDVVSAAPHRVRPAVG